MKKTKRHAWQLLGVVALLAMIAGCADGELAMPMNPDITPPAPMVIKFAATPSTIQSGGSTTISWEVAGADEVEITAVSSTGATVDFNVKTEDLSGEAPVSLTSTTDFVLTATKSAENMETEEGEEITDEGEDITLSKGGQIQFGPEPVDEQPSGSAAPAISSVTQTITVTVSGASNLTAKLNADKPVVAVGEQTVIRWTVSPAENVSVVVTADSGETISPTDACDGSITDILGQPGADPVPAVGCAVVAPSSMTTYSVTATDAYGDTASDTAVVDVEGDVEAKIMAAKDEGSTPEDNLLIVESFSKPVIVSWTVTPEAAKVTVTATPSATCELPVDAEGQTTGSVSCTISGETKFTITAALGTETDTDDVVVTAGGGNAGLVVADAWAFKGETISLDMRLKKNANTGIVAKLLINGTAQDQGIVDQLKAGSTVSVRVENVAEPVHVQLMDSSNAELDSEEKVSVVGLAVKGLGSTLLPDAAITERRVSSVMFDKSSGTPYAGVELDYSDMARDGDFFGKARIYKNHAPIEFNFVNSIKDYAGMGDMWNDAFFHDMDTYPTVVAVRENNSNDIFVGTTGAIMRSKDGGSTWENAMVSRRRAEDGFSSSNTGHPTCGRAVEGGQKVQKNRQPQFNGDFVSINQVCDIIAFENGRVIAAMDFGVMVAKNIDDEDFIWFGIPNKNLTQTEIIENGILTFGKVVNDLIEVDGKIFAATSDGIYVSSKEQGGLGWALFGDDVESPVWSLAYDKRNNKIYAGNDVGIHASSPSSPDWDYIGLDTTPVLSIAVDPKSPLTKMTIIAGTPTGVQISRDNGSNWYPVTLEGGEQPVESLAIHAEDSGSTVTYSIAMGTSMGELFQDAIQVGAQTVPNADLPTYTLAPGAFEQE